MAAESPSITGSPTTAAIVFAMNVEADGFAALAKDVVSLVAAGLTIHEGVVAGRRVAWCVGGVGAVAAARATRLLIDGHRPMLMITAGFAGALDRRLKRGVAVVPRRCISTSAAAPIELFAGAYATDDVTLVSTDRVVTTAGGKRELAEATGAALVDMETHAVASTARAAGLSCVSIRVISDDAATDLPKEIAALVQPQSPLRRLGAAIGAVGRRPHAAVDMWRLWEHAVVDGRTLAQTIVRFLQVA